MGVKGNGKTLVEIPGDIALFGVLEGVPVKHKGRTFHVSEKNGKKLCELLMRMGYIALKPRSMDVYK